jgi:hypothetical protein
MALLRQGRIAFLPGSDSAAFDYYNVQGEFLGSYGLQEHLPMCTEPGCERVGVCFNCQMISLGDSIIAVAEGITPRIVFFNVHGDSLSSISFADLDVMREWKEETRARIRSHGDIRRPNSVELKTFFSNLSAIGNGRIAVSVIPARSYLREYGSELWIVGSIGDSTDIIRYRYDNVNAGADAVVSPGAVYAVNEGRIDRYAFSRR